MRKLLIALSLAFITHASHAADTEAFACLPKQLHGRGTQAVISVANGCAWAGWYCHGLTRWPQIVVMDLKAVTSVHQQLIALVLTGDLDLPAMNDIRSRLATGNVWSGPLYACWSRSADKLLAIKPPSWDIHINELQEQKYVPR